MPTPPRQQKNWDARAALNFMCGGSGAGLLLFGAVVADESSRALTAMALLLVALGLFGVWTEIRRPLRAWRVFLNPRSSWMSREAVAALLMFVAGAVAIGQRDQLFGGIAALCGVVFLGSQAGILASCRSIPAWREPKIIPLILSTGIAEGAGLTALLAGISPGKVPEWLVVALLGTLLLRRLSWRLYSKSLADQGAPPQSLEALQKLDPPFRLLAQTLPELMVGIAIIFEPSRAVLLPVAGVMAVAGGWALKFAVVMRAAYNQGFR